MKRQTPIHASILLIVALLTACGPAEPTATPLPTLTATPLPTPLAVPATEVPLASAGRPLPILFVPYNLEEASPSDLESRIESRSGLDVQVSFVSSYGEMIERLCAAEPVAAWLDGVSFAVALARGCGDPALQIERDGAMGSGIELLMPAELDADADSADAEQELVLCRVNDEPAEFVLMADLMLYNQGMHPVDDLRIVEVADYNAVVEAISAGDCQMGAVPAGYLEDAVAEQEGEPEDATVEVAAQSPVFPLGVMVYSEAVSLHVRMPVTSAFLEMDASPTQASFLKVALGQDGLAEVEQADFSALQIFMESTGLDFTALGE